MQTDSGYIHRSTGPQREEPAVCHTCGAGVEDGPRFGAEATCDECRRHPPEFARFAFAWDIGPVTLRMYTVCGGTHDRSTLCEETVRALGIEVRE